MRLARVSLLAASIVFGAGASLLSGALAPTDAHASVSIAVGFDALVKDADAVGIATPLDSKSVWEEGRIYTYTHVKIDQGIAGELGTGGEGWIRTMGGVVGKIGQLVDGEPVFTAGKASLVFLRKFKQGGTFEVSARAQGQYPVVVDEGAKVRKVIRSSAVGVLYPPKTVAQAEGRSNEHQLGPVAPKPEEPKSTITDVAKVRLAGEVIHERPLDDVAKEIAVSWKRLHPAASDAKK